MFTLGHNLGYTHVGEALPCTVEDIDARRESAWTKVRDGIDQGLPAYGWELAVPEYYVIHGYEGEEYLFVGPGAEEKDGRCRWDEVGDTGIGWLEVYSVHPQPARPDAEIVKAALEFAVAFGQDGGEWRHDGYNGGLQGYDLWITAMGADMEDAFGLSYNAACWAECRRYAGAFLREAASRLPGVTSEAFAAAAEAYETVARELTQINTWYPFPGKDPKIVADRDRRRRAVQALERARTSETAGLAYLDTIVAAL